MARKSALRLAADSALANLAAIHLLALEASDGATYVRNAGDCSRWCKALRDAGAAYPAFMTTGGLPYFAALWGLPKPA
jgi:hypothetical protein